MDIPPRRVVHRFENAVLSALRGPCALVPPLHGDHRTRLLVGVSGGPDSLALLHALARIAARGRGAARVPRIEVTAAYVDHGLRDAASVAAERAFVTDQATALNLRLLSGAVDTRALARRERRSIEDAARRGRYTVLRDLAHRAAADTVAVGHTTTDQAETVLMRMIRGAGVRGLAAMDWRSMWPLDGFAPVLVRPLLALRREDTEAYCAALGLVPRRDPANASPRHLRNRIRAELLPLLSIYNPQIVAALGRLAESARDADTFLQERGDCCWEALAHAEDGAQLLDRAALGQLPPILQSAVLRRAATLISADVQPEHEHIRAVTRVLRSGASPRTIEWPGGVRVRVEGDTVRVSPPASEARPAPVHLPLVGEWPITREGRTDIPGWRVRATAVVAAPAPSGDRNAAWLRPAVFDREVVATARRAGDRLRPLGMAGEKKVHDLLVDARVPRAARDRVPIVRAAGEIAWVVGVRLAAWAAARPGEPAVLVSFTPQ